MSYALSQGMPLTKFAVEVIQRSSAVAGFHIQERFTQGSHTFLGIFAGRVIGTPQVQGFFGGKRAGARQLLRKKMVKALKFAGDTCRHALNPVRAGRFLQWPTITHFTAGASCVQQRVGLRCRHKPSPLPRCLRSVADRKCNILPGCVDRFLSPQNQCVGDVQGEAEHGLAFDLGCLHRPAAG
jgi:hypothetical protein